MDDFGGGEIEPKLPYVTFYTTLSHLYNDVLTNHCFLSIVSFLTFADWLNGKVSRRLLHTVYLPCLLILYLFESDICTFPILTISATVRYN